jgi:leucyl/phenylalanyl-tRNA--protein transferase
MELDDFKLSRSLIKSIKKFTYKFDTDFNKIITRCATKKRFKQDGTWIQDEIIEAYETLFGMGVVHSIGSYQNNKLVGGLYGVVVGGVFCGESMFSDVNDASKAAFSILIKHLKYWGYSFIDCQVPTNHLKSLGAKEITRAEFLNKLKKATIKNINHKWEIIN